MSLTVENLSHPLRVKGKIQETPEAVSLVLEIPPALKDKFRYQAGQFVTFFLKMGSETLSRSYSLCSSPLVDPDFQVTVKKVDKGRGSTFLCDQLKVGDTLLTTPPAGHFFKPPPLDKPIRHYFLFGAGSGITPLYSILKTVLQADSNNKVTLVFCNRNQSSIIFKNDLDRWVNQAAGRLKVIHVLSKPENGWQGSRGRLSRQMIGDILNNDLSAHSWREFYLCGPNEYMDFVRSTLLALGFSKDVIREESFGPVPAAAPTSRPEAPTAPAGGPKPQTLNPSWTLIGPERAAASGSSHPEKITAQINGETIEVDAVVGKSILETLLEAGAQPPYSCMDGACMACLAKVQKGLIYQEDPGILSDDNITNCEALTCQAKPLSKNVVVSYDNL
jgi:ring-1,2-phenylacetyl-CoA epoxidase subunit PaaE